MIDEYQQVNYCLIKAYLYSKTCSQHKNSLEVKNRDYALCNTYMWSSDPGGGHSLHILVPCAYKNPQKGGKFVRNRGPRGKL